MDLKMEVGQISYVIGILFGIVTILFFGREVAPNLSPTVKSIILLTAFFAFLVAGSLSRSGILEKILFVLGAVSYIAFLSYTISTFGFGVNEAFLSMVLSSLLFIGIGYLGGRELGIGKSWKKTVLAGLLIFILGLTSIDVLGAQPTYSLEVQEDFNPAEAYGDGSEAKIGAVIVKNDFVFSRFADPPKCQACLYTPEKHEVYLSYSEWGSFLVGGGETREVDISVRIAVELGQQGPPEYLEDIGSVPIEVAENCPESAEEPKLVVATGGELSQAS